MMLRYCSSSVSICRCAVSCSTSPSAMTAEAWLRILSTFRLPSSTISSKARLERKGAAEEEVADEHARGSAPDEVRGPLAAAHARAVDDVVVEQGRGVNELDRG